MTSAAAGARRQRRGLLGALDAAFRPLENAAAIAGGVMMVLAMVLMTMDAVLRYLFSAPIQFAPRLIEFYFMVGMFSMPLAWGFRTGGYIRIMAGIASFPARARTAVLRLGLLVSSVYVAGLAWTSGGHFLETWRTGEVYVGVLDWSVAWSWIWVPVGLALLAVRLVLMAFGAAEDLTITHSEGT